MFPKNVNLKFIKKTFPNCWKKFLLEKLKINQIEFTNSDNELVEYLSFLSEWNDYNFLQIFENMNIKCSIIYERMFNTIGYYYYNIFIVNKQGVVKYLVEQSKERPGYLTNKETLIHIIYETLNILENDVELLNDSIEFSRNTN